MRARRGRRLSTPTRQRVWARTTNIPAGTAFAAGAASATCTNLLGDYETISGALVQGATIGGVRGWVNATAATTGVNTIVFGMKVGDRSFATLPSATLLLQGPLTGGRYDDWNYRDARVTFPSTIAYPAHLQQQVMPGQPLVRSKRKLPELNDTLLFFAEVPASNAQVMTLYFDLSVLLLLP